MQCTDEHSGVMEFNIDKNANGEYNDDDSTADGKDIIHLDNNIIKYTYQTSGYKRSKFYCEDKAENVFFDIIDEPKKKNGNTRDAICCICKQKDGSVSRGAYQPEAICEKSYAHGKYLSCHECGTSDEDY